LTYYLKDVPTLQKKKRQDKEKSLGSGNIPFPGWDVLEKEKLEQKPQVVFVIKNQAGEVVRNIFEEAKSGVHRTSWDLRYPNYNPIALDGKKHVNSEEELKPLLAAPGKYSVTMYLSHNGAVEQLDAPVEFNVKPLYKNTLEGSTMEVTSSFWRSYEAASRTASAFDKTMVKMDKKTKALHRSIMHSTVAPEIGLKQLGTITERIHALKSDYYGNQAKLEIGEKNPPTVNDKMFTIYLSMERSTYGPTETNKEQMTIINTMLLNAQNELEGIQNEMQQLETLLKASGAPYIDD
jgi:hypothetical protein